MAATPGHRARAIPLEGVIEEPAVVTARGITAGGDVDLDNGGRQIR
jgi:hypothetical protein